MKIKLAWSFLAVGIGFLTAYLFLVFKTSMTGTILTFLILSVISNVVAVNLFISARPKRRHEDD